MYKVKFIIALIFATAWATISIWLSQSWIEDLAVHIGLILALLIVLCLAIIPGFMNAFTFISLLMDKRQQIHLDFEYPPVTILVAAYNEERSIKSTLLAILRQTYPAEIKVIVINDGSKDLTVHSIQDLQVNHANLDLIDLGHNGGKASALNHGLARCTTNIVITVDADSRLIKNAIQRIVGSYLSSHPDTKAVAGAVFISNSGENWITKAQQWDYALGIGAIKRVQSLFHGTLVAQGAFSLYDRKTLLELGGWPIVIGEDIVLTWRILARGFRVAYSENAIAFTRCPNTLIKLIKQRQRWGRGMIEAFKDNAKILFKPRLTTLFIWWNVMFPVMDIIYTFCFIPGVILALFGIYWIAGPMTLTLLPMAYLLNLKMYFNERNIFHREHLRIKPNKLGFFIYILAYGLILQPSSVYGYFSEIFNLRKNWGTK